MLMRWRPGRLAFDAQSLSLYAITSTVALLSVLACGCEHHDDVAQARPRDERHAHVAGFGFSRLCKLTYLR